MYTLCKSKEECLKKQAIALTDSVFTNGPFIDSMLKNGCTNGWHAQGVTGYKSITAK